MLTADYSALIDFPLRPGQLDAARLRLAFAQPARWLLAQRVDEVRAVLDAAHAAALAGQWCVGYVAYEAAPAFDAALQVHAHDPSMPLAAFAVFDSTRLPWPHAQQAWQCQPWCDPLLPQAFTQQVEQIREAIRRGEVYQVNLTTQLRSGLTGDPLSWFGALQRGQPGGYAAYLRGPAGAWGCASVSPELFFDWRDGKLISQPMKGTALRGPTPQADAQQAQQLHSSDKERAENLMIVDLLRNDFARVAQLGSVQVPKLFELHALPTVWQMTSTIQAQTLDGITLSDVFAALFPCGSVTGAPKIQAMKTIQALESGPRGVYCGAVGVLAPGGAATFNVPIRTPVFHPQGAEPGEPTEPTEVERLRWRLRCGIGSGITLDSSASGEAAEWQAKQRFLERAAQPFELLESLRLEAGVIWLLDEHLSRIQASAAALGFVCDPQRLRDALHAAARAAPQGVYKLRLLLTVQGQVQVQTAPLTDLVAPGVERRVALATRPIASSSEFVRHKTTHRRIYAEFSCGADEFDVLLWNPAGELTEFTLGNVALQMDGQWLTPELPCGLLPGTYRRVLIEQGRVVEARLRVGDLQRAQAVAFFNSVRGWLPVALAPLQQAAASWG